ncbi:MAG: CPBP family intramembrane glutamic endopeptidase [Thermoleophilaceae bacterium]
MATAVETPPPPDPPELPDGVMRRPEWPWWFALAGFFVGVAGTLLLVAIVGGILVAATGSKSDSPAFVVVGTLFQGLAFGATALFFASRVTRPKAWHFGLRGAPLWSTIGWAALAVATFYVLTIVYGLAVKPDAKQDTVNQLGGDQGTLGLIVAGTMVIAVAPVVEEFFFRGFFYRALRNRFSWAIAAVIDGLLFGSIHYPGNGVDGLLILPPLAVLGFLFCLVYERTGTLLAPIGMHAVNNTIAFAAQADGGWQVSVVVGPLMLGAVVLAGRLLPRAPRLSSA